MASVGIVQSWSREKRKQKRLFRIKIRRGVHSTRSSLARRNRGELAPASARGQTGCCGFTGPNPSATLDKISTKLSADDSMGQLKCKQRESRTFVSRPHGRGHGASARARNKS